MEPPRLSIAARSPADLLAILKTIDIKVPSARDGRTSQHREQYLMAHFLATLSEESEIRYPLELRHREKPDFLLRLDGRRIGVECVEAVSEEWKRIDAIRDRKFPDALIVPPMLTPGKRIFSNSEQIDIARGEGPSYPWCGDMAARQWAQAIAYFIEKKTQKLRCGNYSEFEQHWLLIQDEWRAPIYEKEEKQEAAELCELLLKKSRYSTSFEKIYVASGQYIIRLLPSPIDMYLLYDLWRK